MFVKRSCTNFFGFFKNFSKMVQEQSDARYEAELSEDDLVVFLGVGDFGLSDAFE